MAAQFQFVMRSGPTPGATFSLEGDQIIIGRDSSSGVAINDAEVSRKHARLEFQGGKYVLTDLGSTNGTFVNGQRVVGQAVLKSGDVVSLGEQIVLMYETLSMDPGATVAVSRKSVPRPAPAPAPAPVPAPAPQQYYAPPVSAAPAGRKNMPIIIIGAVVLLCACITGVWFWFAPASFWCTFPFSLIAQMMGGVCP